MAASSRGESQSHYLGDWALAHCIFIVCLVYSSPSIPDYLLMVYRIDDIQDMSLLRRGRPVAHRIFGVAQTINSANYAYFLGQQRLYALKSPKALEIFTEELLNLHRGQGLDLFWRDSLNCPTEEEYLEMVSNKTGGLFRLAIRLLQLESDREKYVLFSASLPSIFVANKWYCAFSGTLFPSFIY